ncbi:cytochrome c peroxidase [Pyxidicoccus xibeiensis]|uniref:cytochrome c peroxidase n=1 Tax=Pyxidicoccus xibeiensis TaxID=2906759 RepID=UPI0020A76423|nr:cytochrome c peroxidase [Pyxidicoccus xibeiensis]MCP3143176.1 cytochrome-c peroxidase [Pyxidicoccus xibeiensis]
MLSTRVLACLASAFALGGLTNCTSDSAQEPEEGEVAAATVLATTESPSALKSTAAGKKLFSEAFANTNGRSCATCHVLDESTALRPENVQARLASNPNDPLFNRIDADDPEASVPTYEHLKKGLVRVVLPLPANMDVIDTQGNVITPPDRKIAVWRGVPSIQDVAITGPHFQLDGRESNLEDQAQAAITSHSEGGPVSRSQLRKVADFQRGEFTSPRARFVSDLLGFGVPLGQIPVPEDFMWLTPQELRGREVFKVACEACHGGATLSRISHPGVLELAAQFPVTKPDGNVLFTHVPGVGPVPAQGARADVNIVNVAFSGFSYLGQIGQFPVLFNTDIELPRYRFRFYTDGTRTQQVTDLPPNPVTASGHPYDPNPKLDENGAPIVGPNLFPQWFSTDPGRAVITGNPLDFEAFDIPTLRGISRTAPYYHDNSVANLEVVVDIYSQFVLPFTTPLNLPPVHPPETPGGPPESLSATEKQDLLKFLHRL